jgi:hypothetical protein
MTVQFSPGDLVRARGREWVTLPHDDPAALRLRPLSGTEADALTILPALERVPVEAAHFVPPEVDVRGTQESARLLAEALRLSLRRGAGPFRSSARVSFEPRAYQLVPLLMAMRLSVVRLLIADDVGIGKTIEAGLILRELLDRGEIERFCVLCPPHLVEQWVGELRAKFDIEAVAVTSASAPRLERKVVGTQSLFEVHPFTVVSLDYIKAEKRRESFAASCPPCVVVDEAHACVGTHGSRQRRYRLLQRLAKDAARHMLLLTATPHSGDEEAFDRLLKLLDESFAMEGLDTNAGRIALARHFVQRRRKDILEQKWEADQIFPKSSIARTRSAQNMERFTTPFSTTASTASRTRATARTGSGSRSGRRWRCFAASGHRRRPPSTRYATARMVIRSACRCRSSTRRMRIPRPSTPSRAPTSGPIRRSPS